MKTLAHRECSIFFTFLFFVDIWARLTRRPEGDVFGLLYDTVELNCATDSHGPINWEFSSYGTTTYSWIYLNSEMTRSQETRYQIVTGNGSYRLIMKSLDWSYAGKYRCTDEAGLGQSATTQVTVIDEGPKCCIESLLGQPRRSPCFLGPLYCELRYLGDTVPTFALSKHIYEQNTTAHTSRAESPKKLKLLNISVDQSCGKANQMTETTKSSRNETCNPCLLLVHSANDGKLLVTEEDFETTIYKMTLNNSKIIGLLSFTSPFHTEDLFHVQKDRDANSRASCGRDETTTGLSILVSLAAIGLVVLNLTCGKEESRPPPLPAPPPPPGSGRNVTGYEDVEGDFSESFQIGTGETVYDAIGQREAHKPCIYDRLKGARHSAQTTKHRATNDEKEAQMSTGASWDPESSRTSEFEKSYITLVE